MNQFKDVFLGLDKRNYPALPLPNAACVRVVNTTTWKRRLHRASPYLLRNAGQLQLRDYFKHDAIQFAWELLTSEKGLPCRKSVCGLPSMKATTKPRNLGKRSRDPARTYYSHRRYKGAPYASDNFWQMGDTGPCARAPKSSTITATTFGVALRESGRRRRPLH